MFLTAQSPPLKSINSKHCTELADFVRYSCIAHRTTLIWAVHKCSVCMTKRAQSHTVLWVSEAIVKKQNREYSSVLDFRLSVLYERSHNDWLLLYATNLLGYIVRYMCNNDIHAHIHIHLLVVLRCTDSTMAAHVAPKPKLSTQNGLQCGQR